MRELYSRRDVLRLGLSLGAAGLVGCNQDEAAFGFGGHGSELPITPPRDTTAPGYKALVCVFMAGGNDGFNTVIPLTQEKYDLYSAARLNLAIPQAQLLPLNATAPDGASYGMQQATTELCQLFNSGRAAVVGNLGSLAYPVNRDDYLASRRLPARLFSHNDQADQWQSTATDGAASLDGWAGRLADVLSGANGNAELPVNISVAGANLLQRGRSSAPFSISRNGPVKLSWPAGSSLRSVYDSLRSAERGHPFEQTYAEVHSRAIRLNQLLEASMADAAPLATAFPATILGAELKMVAQLIQVRAALGMKRQVFYVSNGGYDTHDGQLANHPARLTELSQAMSAFYQATVEMGIAESVTSFTASDFGRSLTVNGKGTDHGWSSHHLVVGGAVRGGQFYGGMPSLVLAGADDTRGGRFIPSVSVDEYAATFARWLGAADGDLGYIVPNLGRFATRGLGFL
ncbi:MAG TPA: DUF1501 domain-containing protein [Solimonas sp.]|nr:DUF1501 domain-containing protein [Solimonas sp.]